MDNPVEQSALASMQDWRFYLSPAAAWEAMYADCAAAKRSIELEQYILENDEIGQKFMKLFIEKAAQGLRVFIICDKFGSFSFRNSPLVQELRRRGGLFHFYHPVTIWNLLMPWSWFPRTHVKTLLIDSSITYVGGVCIAERMADWRDTQIRVTGPVAEQVRATFDSMEKAIRRRRPAKIPPFPRQGEDIRYLQNHPRQERHLLYNELMMALRGAKDYISISTGFFAPNRRFLRSLKAASRRGVQVTLLVPQFSDVLLADWTCLSYAAPLLRAGVRIFHYQPTVLHNKIVIVDDAWATIGSTNMDILSFFRNRESNLVITRRDIIAALKKDFVTDLQSSKELTQAALAELPLWKRLGGYMGRALKSFW
ncbi:MAG: phospholipase D-like domain-containing protein [Alphaproteobacteria bacterium]|nr:phospholipase D-like domain-containing protein [Alphaproteobacteria bacterium]